MSHHCTILAPEKEFSRPDIASRDLEVTVHCCFFLYSIMNIMHKSMLSVRPLEAA